MRVCPRCRDKYPDAQRFCPNDSAVLVDEIDASRINTTIGNYFIHDVIGRGGMGTVYSGEHIYIRKKVAIKILHARFAQNREAVGRFLTEARAASSIRHPNIVDVTDFGPMAEGGVYFVMEYLDGMSLEDRIEKEGCLPLHRALNITNQICLALAAAHDEHIVHRDLKPENIMLIRKPGRRDVVRSVPREESSSGYITERELEYDFVKVLDFGIAKVLTPDEVVPETLHGAVFGTPEYMSPEAARGLEVDWRADIYSVGVILFDMLTGRPPFEAEAAAEVLAMQISEPPPSPRAMAPYNEITPACERLILKAMAKDPAMRQQSIDELRDELQSCYGSIVYHRDTLDEGEIAWNREARRTRLTDELDDWLRSDSSSLTLEQARMLAAADEPRQQQLPAIAAAVAPALSPEEEERLASALDAALGDDDDW